MFVNEFYNLQPVSALFRDSRLGKVVEECRIISTEKGETFTFPFYMTEASLLTFDSMTAGKSFFCLCLCHFIVSWKGKLAQNLPASFVGLFCSLQHVVQVKICWKNEETGEIGFTRSEAFFTILRHPKWLQSRTSVLGLLSDFKISADVDSIFPDHLEIVDREQFEKISLQLKHAGTDKVAAKCQDANEAFRDVVEGDPGYDRSITVDLSDSQVNCTIATLHLRKTCIHPGTQIFISLILLEPIDRITVKLECCEIYPKALILPQMNAEWRDVVKELDVVPGCKERLDLVLSVPPNLQSTTQTDFFELNWHLAISFYAKSRNFDLTVPLKLVPLNLKLNK